MDEPITTINVSLSIPGQKVMAQAMDVFERYHPIVEEALAEVKEKLVFDTDFQQKVKYAVMDTVERVMKEGIEKAAKEIVTNAYFNNYEEIKAKVNETIKDILDPNKNNQP